MHNCAMRIACAVTLALPHALAAPIVIVPPPEGMLYHGVYPGGSSGWEDDITSNDVESYQAHVSAQVAWVYFSHNWFNGRAFPMETARWIRDMGAVPFIRLMLRSPRSGKRAKEKIFTLQAIIDGACDADLAAWGAGAKAFGTPLLVEYGTECNGEWFAWNGRWNGGKKTKKYGDPTRPDGPERFVAAYRHIVAVIRSNGADNITWVFHVNWDDSPVAGWNRFEQYYPGGDVVDWIGISAYGPQTPMEQYADEFRDMMDSAYARVTALAPGKPVVALEFGCTAGSPAVKPAGWAGRALADLVALRWPRVIGFSWWNERWQNDRNPQHDTTMRVQDIPELATLFRTQLAAHASMILQRPLTNSTAAAAVEEPFGS